MLYKRRIDRVLLDVRADRQRDRAMGVDVVRSVLRVVLDHEDRHLLPEPALAQPLDDPSERQVVVADAGRHRPLARRGARRVVIRQLEDHQPRHLAGFLEAGQLLEEAIGSLRVGIVHVEASVHGVEVALERFHVGRRGLIGLRRVPDELAIAAIRDPLLGRLVPDVAAGRSGRLEQAPLGGVGDPAIATIADRPDPLDEVARIRPHRPFMPVGADLAVHVEVVQQHEFASQRMVVGRDGLGEQAEVRLAVALGHVAEDLVVSAILLDDIDDVLDRRRITDLRRDGVARGRGGAADRGRIAAVQRRARVDGLRMGRHPPGVGHGDDGQRPLEEAADVLDRRAAGAGTPAAGRRGWRATSSPCRWPRRSSCRRETAAPTSDTNRPG